MPKTAALRAAVFGLSSKNLKGGVINDPLIRARVQRNSYTGQEKRNARRAFPMGTISSAQLIPYVKSKIKVGYELFLFNSSFRSKNVHFCAFLTKMYVYIGGFI